MSATNRLAGLFVALILFLAACDLLPSPPVRSGGGASSTEMPPAAQAPVRQTAVRPTPTSQPTAPAPTPQPTARPPIVVEYNLGETTITQEDYAADDPFRELPVRLDGLIGVPSEAGAHPLVLILHGEHTGCPPDTETDAALWPCAREKEQRNYRGFEYLVQSLASQGYVAVAININGVYTKGFGEDASGGGRLSQQRLSQIIDLHLERAITAAGGGENQFGVDLYGRIDPLRLVWIAHSASADLAARIIRERGLHEAVGAAFAGYGPVQGLLLAAPMMADQDALPPPDLPFAVLLPACDGRSPALAGQAYYEAARGQDRSTPALSVLLSAANHNQFNAAVPPDLASSLERPACRLENLLAPAEQQGFLAGYAAAFSTYVTGDAQESRDAASDLGLDPAVPVPGTLFGRDVLLSISPPTSAEELLFRPTGEAELSRNLLGGQVLAENLTLTFCPQGTAVFEAGSALAACHRLAANHPGNPPQMLVTWDKPGAALRLTLPEGGIDLSGHAALHLRAVPDPLSGLNPPGENMAFTVSLTDANGQSASVPVPAAEAALAYPAGEIITGEPQRFSGHVQMSSLRIPLAAFEGIDLAAVSEMVLNFDGRPSGAIFLADLGFVRAPRYAGATSTLLSNTGSLDRLRSIGRFLGAATCTAVLIDTGAPQSPAVVLTAGHCAQPWSANDVNLDLPAENMQMVFNYFANTRQVQIAVPAARVLYSTMKGRDVALIELAATQEELAARDIVPFPLAAGQPDPADDGLPVTVIGAPLAELPSDAAYLRREDCLASGQVSVLENEWQFDDALRLDCQDIYGGSSGSPVFAAGIDEILAIISTTSIGGQSPCRLNAPCEITPAGVSLQHDTSYAAPVNGLSACFNDGGRLDLAQPDCPLDDGRQLQISGVPQQAVRPTARQENGAVAANTWNAHLSGDLPYYRYKSGPVGAVDCRNDDGYSPVYPLAERPVIDDALPESEGLHTLCLLGGPSPVVDDTWQPPRFATSIRVEIDTTPPLAAPSVSLATSGGELLIQPDLDPPEITAVDYKLGPIAGTDCADRTGYASFGLRPLSVPTANLPALLCLIPRDAAGNPGLPLRQIVDSP
ncbi:MAG: trypsin-like peptidase domain-containing protein [Candidatus Promineifilaceae bacterium]